jgi:hypothetical protein
LAVSNKTLQFHIQTAVLLQELSRQAAAFVVILVQHQVVIGIQ